MPILMPTDFYGKITWLGRVAPGKDDIRSAPVEAVDVTYAGVPGELHSGLTRPSCSRVLSQHQRGTEIRNTRQLSILSAEEMTEIAAAIGLERLEPEWLGATVVLEGIPDLSHVPPSSRLQSEAGTTLVIDMQNGPCIYPGKEIEKDAPGHGKAFKPAAQKRRGVTAWVEREGPLRVGDSLRLHIPDQRPWAHAG